MRNPEFHRALGKRITQLRKQQGYTQAELARVLGLSQQTVFAYELGDRRVGVDRLPLLARTLEVTADVLLGPGPLPPLPKARVSPAELRLIEQLRGLTVGDRHVVKRMAEALRRQ